MGEHGFVGGKIVAEYFGVEVSTMMSLAVVFSTLGAGIGASILLKPEDDPTETRKSLKDTYATTVKTTRSELLHNLFSRLAMRTQEPCAIHREPYASQSHATARQDAHSRPSPVILTLTGPLLHLRSSQHTPPHSLVSAHRSVLRVM